MGYGKGAAHCKILELQVMNMKMNGNSMERVQKKHFSFNSRMGTSLACSRRSDSGERCEVKMSAKK